MASPSRHGKTSTDVIIYVGYLASFIALLYASTMIFGDNALTLTFGAFLVGVMGLVTAASRSLLY
jgi:hypothetical protein